MLKNKYYQVKVLLKRFHSNGNPINHICRPQRFHHLIVRLYLSPWKWKVPFVYFSVILKEMMPSPYGIETNLSHFIVVLGWSLTWSRLKNRFWWILPWKRYPKFEIKILDENVVACERQTFLLAHRRWGTFRETSLGGDERGETSAFRRLRMLFSEFNLHG